MLSKWPIDDGGSVIIVGVNPLFISSASGREIVASTSNTHHSQTHKHVHNTARKNSHFAVKVVLILLIGVRSDVEQPTASPQCHSQQQ